MFWCDGAVGNRLGGDLAGRKPAGGKKGECPVHMPFRASSSTSSFFGYKFNVSMLAHENNESVSKGPLWFATNFQKVCNLVEKLMLEIASRLQRGLSK